MKLEICNLSDITRADIDLKPLTILVGPNNVGKTWLAYVLSGIFGPRGWEEYSQAYARGQLPKSYPRLDDAIDGVLAYGNATIDLHKFAEEYGERYFQNVADYARNWMHQFMSTQLVKFSNMKVSINLAENKAGFLGQVEKYSLQSRVAGGLFTIRKKQGDKTLYAYTSIEGEEQIAEKLPIEEITESLIRSIFRVLHRALYLNVRVFPTERTTLVTLPFGSRTSGNLPRPLDQQTVDTLETLWQKLQEVSGQTPSAMIERNARTAIGPVANFLNMMSAAFRIGSQQIEARKAKAENDQRIQKCIDLAEILEKQILSGGLAFSTPEPDPRRDILFQATQVVTLEIPIVSSMVKELAPLVFYLRYLAEPGELLIIDEPEMNLHPEAQVKIMEFLAMLVNAGLQVLITTHSPNMVDHLENLIRAAEYEKEAQVLIADEFFLHHSDAFISQENVSVYLIDHKKAENILLEEGKINWGTFGDVSDRVAKIHYQL